MIAVRTILLNIKPTILFNGHDVKRYVERDKLGSFTQRWLHKQ